MPASEDEGLKKRWLNYPQSAGFSIPGYRQAGFTIRLDLVQAKSRAEADPSDVASCVVGCDPRNNLKFMPDITIVENFITLDDLKQLAKQRFGDMIKVVVDINKDKMAIGGELHADEEALLLQNGSDQTDLWGINIYVDQPRDNWLEFDSMINLKPSQDNNSRSVEDVEIRKRIAEIVNQLVK